MTKQRIIFPPFSILTKFVTFLNLIIIFLFNQNSDQFSDSLSVFLRSGGNSDSDFLYFLFHLQVRISLLAEAAVLVEVSASKQIILFFFFFFFFFLWSLQ